MHLEIGFVFSAQIFGSQGSFFQRARGFLLSCIPRRYSRLYWATRYIIDERREIRQASTIEKDVRVLRWLYEWCAFVGIDLETRLRSGSSLTSKELHGIARWFRSGRHQKVVGAIGTVKENSDSMLPILQPRSFNNYISILERFLVWAAEDFIPKGNPAEGVRQEPSRCEAANSASIQSKQGC